MNENSFKRTTVELPQSDQQFWNGVALDSDVTKGGSDKKRVNIDLLNYRVARVKEKGVAILRD